MFPRPAIALAASLLLWLSSGKAHAFSDSLIFLRTQEPLPAASGTGFYYMKESSPKKTLSGALGRSALHTLLPMSVGIAMIASEGTTGGVMLAGLLTMAYGFVAGPSMGNFYLEDYSGGTIGILSRTVGPVLLIAGVAASGGFLCMEECTDDGDLLMWTGLGVTAGGTLWQFLRLPGAARKHRTGSREGPSPKFALAPTWDREKEALGLQLSLRY